MPSANLHLPFANHSRDLSLTCTYISWLPARSNAMKDDNGPDIRRKQSAKLAIRSDHEAWKAELLPH